MWKTVKVLVPMGEQIEPCINKELALIEQHFVIADVTVSFQDRNPFITYRMIDIKK